MAKSNVVSVQMSGIDTLTRVTGRVKWFNQFKGYGFIEVSGLSEDVFLHFSVIDQSKISCIHNEDILLCDVSISDKGYQVISIEEIVQAHKYDTEDQQSKEVIATIKWFNPSKGFGFALLESGEDVFIHSNLLKKHRVKTINRGTKVKLLMHRTNLGYEAIDLNLEADYLPVKYTSP
jgi:CspA family cold shock protein